MYKKVIAIIVALVMCGTACITNVSAKEMENEWCTECTEQSSVQPRGVVCTCGGTFNTRTSYTSWGRTGTQRKCGHGHPWGTDMQLRRTKTVTNKCNKCGLTTENSSYEYSWECHGYTY